MSAESIQLIVNGLLITLALTATSTIVALIFGTVLGVLRVGSNTVLREAAAGYIEFFRNIPILTVLFFMYFGLSRSQVLPIRLSPFSTATWGLGLYTAAYVAEIIRSGIYAVGRGQIEAARSLGLSFTQMLRLVLLPQAFSVAIPPLGTLLIALLKNTSIASTIVVGELFYQAGIVEGRTFNPNIFLIIGMIYVAVNIPLGLLVNYTERRLRILR
ncbi:MAG TPA: amino acid ABC transporter permease [Herpetosiphonaceae bacterium]